MAKKSGSTHLPMADLVQRGYARYLREARTRSTPELITRYARQTTEDGTIKFFGHDMRQVIQELSGDDQADE